MKKQLFLLGFMICSMTMIGQTEKKESWYFKLGGSYFMQTAATEFPTVGGQAALSKVFVGGNLISEESITGSFGEGFRTGAGVGYRFTDRLGVEMGINYYNSNDKTMVKRVDDGAVTLRSVGQIRAFDLAPAIVLFLGEVKGFETYSKVGVIVPVHGDLTIKTNAVAAPGVNVFSKDVIKPNPTLGFQAALGTSYKLAKNLSAFAELEYRNFTVHGKDKETTEFTVNGTDRLNTRTTAQIHSNYSDRLDSNSNNSQFNTIDSTRPTDELSSYVGISGLGLTLGMKYSL
ncbi:opacity protein-like surface antigen [Flavobacterium sp. CG_9.1]|uniref:Outer membrane protein beta-barrel domain-containing protein n=1 Tax=Flavobacterium xanthum TaxID=69322 RepID=A0A1M7F5N7_9FLAO|nr:MULTISPECIES: outer membrane beta-barrel protein [Flavobacterium]MBG6062823.1 opacity protein-like surface antigen [Flavobacterium sp. CG_9.1]SHL99336.1 Outer membrane protein beta-barrel domain-containing protein [Flavobacterium xanthum]